MLAVIEAMLAREHVRESAFVDQLSRSQLNLEIRPTNLVRIQQLHIRQYTATQAAPLAGLYRLFIFSRVALISLLAMRPSR